MAVTQIYTHEPRRTIAWVDQNDGDARDTPSSTSENSLPPKAAVTTTARRDESEV
ncbi:MAG: hypothetical protein O3A01_00555 [bacterium]|nr:hypothetical protein [bacterium]